MNTPVQGSWLSHWAYAYRKLRRWQCAAPMAAMYACRYATLGDTGYVKISQWSKKRLVRDATVQ